MAQATHIRIVLIWIAANAAEANQSVSDLRDKEALAWFVEAKHPARPFGFKSQKEVVTFIASSCRQSRDLRRRG